MTLTYAHIEKLFHRYRAGLTRRLLAIVNSRDAAADLLQDTYMRLLRFASTQPVEQPCSLLHRIAANLAIDHLRAKRGPVLHLFSAQPLTRYDKNRVDNTSLKMILRTRIK